MKKNIVVSLTLFILCVAAVILSAVAVLNWWASQPIIAAATGAALSKVPSAAPTAATPALREFSVKPGSGVRSTAQQIVEAGIPVHPVLLEILARSNGMAARIKAGDYELAPGMTPQGLLDMMVRGQFAQRSISIIEGWTFRQMRAAVAAHPDLQHDTVTLGDAQLMDKLGLAQTHPEGMFFPDTYLFAKGASDLQVYRQANSLLQKRLQDAWSKRATGLPYRSPYEALIMASIVEKETGSPADRTKIAGVFVNRLRIGMLLQTDPTVIYGMGDLYKGNIRKRDLLTDTLYNTYTRGGLPPTPIALPGAAALNAAMQPAQTDALYFVARGDGSSHFSGNLTDHNRAVNKYLR